MKLSQDNNKNNAEECRSCAMSFCVYTITQQTHPMLKTNVTKQHRYLLFKLCKTSRHMKVNCFGSFCWSVERKINSSQSWILEY